MHKLPECKTQTTKGPERNPEVDLERSQLKQWEASSQQVVKAGVLLDSMALLLLSLVQHNPLF